MIYKSISSTAFFCVFSFSLFSMEKSKFTRGNPKSPSLFSNLALSVGKKDIPGVSSAALAVISDTRPTAAYTRAQKINDKAAKQNLMSQVANMDPARPSQAVKEANNQLYEHSLKLAHENWTNILRFLFFGSHENAALCQRIYEKEIGKAQRYYLGLTRSQAYEKGPVEEKVLKQRTSEHFLELFYTWHIESVTYCWQLLSRVAIQAPQRSREELLMSISAPSPLQQIKIPLIAPEGERESEEEHEKDLIRLEVIEEQLLKKDLERIEISSSQTPVNRERSSSVDTFNRIGNLSGVQSTYEFRAEQFKKYLLSAKSYCREWKKAQFPDVPEQQIDDVVASELTGIRETLSRMVCQ